MLIGRRIGMALARASRRSGKAAPRPRAAKPADERILRA
jgi:hypothetical protein